MACFAFRCISMATVDQISMGKTIGSSSVLKSSIDIGKHRKDIDGLRAVAVLSVVAFHLGIPGFGGGYAGVDVFFVISGYLIGGILSREIRDRTFRVTDFYARRAKRILPALGGVVLFSTIAALLLLSPSELKMFSRNSLAALASCSNVLFWRKTGYFSPSADQNPMLMTWSLGVEEQFYFVFPVLMLLMRHLRSRFQFNIILGIALASFMGAAVTMHYYPSAVFFLLPSRVWELAAGVLLVIYEGENNERQWFKRPGVANVFSCIGLSLIVLTVACYKNTTPFPGIAALPSVVGTVLVIACSPGIGNRLLMQRPLVQIGALSYSLYLWHWPLLSFARIVSDTALSRLALLAIGIVAGVAAYLSFRLIESPFRRSQTPTPRLLRSYALFVIALSLPLVAMYVTNGVPIRYPRALTVDDAVTSAITQPCIASYGVAHLDSASSCISAASTPAIAILGDSHAHALAPGIRRLAADLGYGVFEQTKSSCPPLYGVTRNVNAYPTSYEECTEFNQEVLEMLRTHRGIHTAFLIGFWSAPFLAEADGGRYILSGEDGSTVSPAKSRLNFIRGLGGMIDLLQSEGIHVVVVSDVARFDFDPARQQLISSIEPRRVVASIIAPEALSRASGRARMEWELGDQEAASAIVQVLSARPATQSFDLRADLCSGEMCDFAVNGELLYADSQHLTSNGATRGVSSLRLW